MRVALLSDIHGNLEALEAVCRDLKRQEVDEVICLGDIVGYGPNPGECLDLVRANQWPSLQGNHDEAACKNVSLDDYSPLARAGMEFARACLSSEQKKWLRSLPLTQESHGAHLVHSSLNEPEAWNYITDPLLAELCIMEQKLPVCFHGHTHVACVWERADDSLKFNDQVHTRKLRPDRIYLINVGSVGQPRDRNHHSCYLIWQPDERRITFRRVEYDVETTQKKIMDAGLPAALATRLALGK